MKVLDRRTLPSDAVFSTWTAPDGWQIRRMDWRQAAGSIARGTLAFAGGRGDFIEKYLEPLDHWHRRGWNVVSYDWRGQGQSRGEIVGGNFTDFDPLVADAAALIEGIIADYPGPHVAIGHSMGGHLLLRALSEHLPALSAAVLVAPMLGINTSPIPEWLGRMTAASLIMCGGRDLRAWQEAGPEAAAGRIRQINLTHCAERFADELWWESQDPGLYLGPPSWGWLDAAFRSTDRHDEQALRRVGTPLLILGAERDRLVSNDAIRRAARLLPNVQLHMFADAAHEILRESDPVRLRAMELIDRFFDQRAAA